MQKPVLAPDFEPIRKIVEDGEDGLIFKPADRAQLAQSLSRLIDDAALRARLGESARRKILAQHLWRHNAERVLQIHQRIARGGGGPEPPRDAAG
jgi:glycosyltransferase involved in cell wall biosynthesis